MNIFLSVVAENMNNTNEINILTNQAWSSHPENPSTQPGGIWSVQGYKKLSQKEMDKEERGGDLTRRATSITNNIKVYGCLWV